MRNLNDLIGTVVRGTDADIGVLHDFLFDDHFWAVRYMVVKAGDWLNGRELLLSPLSIDAMEEARSLLHVGFDRQTIAKSPEIDIDLPISRQQEIELHEHYQWPFYWDPDADSALGPGSLAAVPLVELGREMHETKDALGPEHPVNLRSAQGVTGYRLHARDGEVGKLDDFVIEDEAWNILYLIIETGTWLSNRKVLISPQWIEKVDWPETQIYVDLKKDTIQHSPELDLSSPIDREYETSLYDHYGKNQYWK